MEQDSALERLRQAFRGSIKEKAKIKFTVDMEEQEDGGRLGLRIDIWEQNNQDTDLPSPSNNTTASNERPIASDTGNNTKETVDTNVPNDFEIDKQAPKNREDTYESEENQYDPNVAIINETLPLDNAPGETVPTRDYGYREDFYHLTPGSDSDASMKTIPEELPRSVNDNEGVGKTREIKAPPPANHEILTPENEMDFDFFEENGGEMHDVREGHGTASLDDMARPFFVNTEEQQCAQPDIVLIQDSDTRNEIVCFIRL